MKNNQTVEMGLVSWCNSFCPRCYIIWGRV